MTETGIRLLPLFIGFIFVAGLLLPLLRKIHGKGLGLILSIFPLILFVSLISLLPMLGDGSSVITDGYFEILQGIDLSFRIDGLSVIFGLMISGIGFFILLYSAFYMAKYERQVHFYFYLILFTGAMTGLVFADNLIALFVFWELTSVTSFLLIGFNHHEAKSRQAALQSLLITGFGGLCLLFAVILIGEAAGTYSIGSLLAGEFTLVGHRHYLLVFIMVAMAVITKSAQFPLHFWLPGAMQAPTPVSSYLHSATMVNAGVFLLLRIHPILGETLLWKGTFMITGGITMFLGAFFSMGQNDLKRILAFTTISALGTMVLLIGLDTVQSVKAAILFFIVHALYKGGLFMMAGIIDKSTGTRDLRLLSNISRAMPFTAVAGVLALISMAGLPPMLGFIGKELIYEAKIGIPGFSWIVMPLGIGANIMMVAISLKVFRSLFLPDKNMEPTVVKHRESSYPWYFPAGTFILAVAGLVLGLIPGTLDRLIGNALLYSYSTEIDVHLSMWHGFNKALLASVFTVISGIIVFRFRAQVSPLVNSLIVWFDRLFLPEVFANFIKQYLVVAARSTRRMQHGYHRFYLITFFLVTLGLVAWQLFSGREAVFPESDYAPFRLHVALLLFVSALAVLFAVFSPGRLSAIVAMGVVGYGIGMLYLYFGAIDLAITQFLAETILMVLFVMVVYKLPRFAVLSTPRSRSRDLIISSAVGVMVVLVVLNARFLNLFEPVSSYFVENSYKSAYGKNIVNVILVDFRALDTLGEITVLTLAAVGVYALFNIKVKKATKEEEAR